MAIKLWTVHFMRICLANLLLFASLYMLFPALSSEMADRFGVAVAETGVIYLFFLVGLFLVGPFHAYLVDAYKRKTVCMFSFATVIAATAGYAFATNMTELIALSTVQGVAFGMATTAGITLAIDITNSPLRSVSNVNFFWIARLGMILGIALGVWLYHSNTFRNLLTVSMITGAVGILAVSGVYVPFRAPIVTRLYSFDRFLLLRAWVPFLNLVLILFVPGLLVSMAHPFLNDKVQTGIPMPFFIGVGAGYLLSVALTRLAFLKDKTWRLGMLGIGLEIIAFYLLSPDESLLLPSVLLGAGLGLVLPEFLIMFVKLSQHCQRGTANTTHLLACETGILIGVIAACYMDTDAMLCAGRIIASLALLFFLLITYPYYRKMKVR